MFLNFYGSGWLIEGGEKIHLAHSSEMAIVNEHPDCWHYILRGILDYLDRPILFFILPLLAIALKWSRYIVLFMWSAFWIFIAELLETAWCRIPNNETCENSAISTLIILLIILHAGYKVTIMMQTNNEKFITGFGLGVAASKTIFSKIWWVKFLSMFKFWL